MKRIVIIGSGLAGLSCAYYLLKNNQDIDLTLIEENRRVGGRVYGRQ